MITTAKWICSSLLLMVPMAWAQDPTPTPTPTEAPVPEWVVTTAPARLVVEPDRDSPPAQVTLVPLCLQDPNWVTQPIRVFTDTGTAVGSSIVWTAPGETTTLAFDSSSGAKQYKIYLGSNWPALPLDHPQSGVIFESRAGNGNPINNLAEMIHAWQQSTTVYGQAVLEGLFEGGNRFGPQGNAFEHFQGWFDVTAPEHLQLASISDDAAFLLVDGKEVVAAPGLHDVRPGIDGKYMGAVDLTPGIHLLECYYAFVQNGNQYHQMLCCVEAKGGALTEWSMLYPNAHFFRPIGHAHLVDYQLAPSPPGTAPVGSAPPFTIQWNFRNQSIIAPDVPDIGLICERVICLPKQAGTMTWSFDDGTTAQGEYVDHVFPRPGIRKVHLSVNNGTQDLGSVDRTINVHPGWLQLNGYQPDLVPAHLADLMARDPATFSVSDLAGCVAVFGTHKSSDGLLKILPTVCARVKDFNEADLSYVQTAALFLAREDVLHFSEASRLLKALVDRCSGDSASVQLVTMGSKARLTLAQLTLKTTDQTADVRALLDAINVKVLTADEAYASAILQADLTLATGDVEGAKKQYQKLTVDPTGPDARSSIRLTAKISQARAFLDRKDFDAAEGALNEVALQTPLEKMSPDWALTRLRLYQEQGLPVAAYLWATRLLPVLMESGRSELLFRLTDLAFAQGHDDVAGKALTELLQKHPYSEEAAQAKEKWPDKG